MPAQGMEARSNYERGSQGVKKRADTLTQRLSGRQNRAGLRSHLHEQTYAVGDGVDVGVQR